MEQEDVQQNNMISNLPLLFANGYPTSLDKISESQLENFIPFMVQCSLGHINLQGKIDWSEPEWWPEDFPFTNPFSKPKKFNGNWMVKMKEIVTICYQFHKSSFLLRFCNDLAAYEHASLRFINNYNSTTSLFDRRSNKLLVTFRNENMSYDQPQKMRKCLLQQKTKSECQEPQQIMVEPAPFDIYLCDNCDAELYSKEAFLEHEKTCNMDENDVILCDTPEPEDCNSTEAQNNDSEDNELHIGFMLNFNLQYRGVSNGKSKNIESNDSATGKEENLFMILDKNRRMPRRNRAVHSLTRCPTIPLSSPAGQLLLRTTKTGIAPEYLFERLDRLERFCHAPLLSKLSIKPKYLEKKFIPNNQHCTFKKPHDYSSHVYVFPRRQFSQRRRTENFLFLNSPLIRRCRPISVRLKKITEREVQTKRFHTNSKINIKLTRDTTRSSNNWKISSPSTEIIVDTIDLCSSDEEDISTANITHNITTSIQSSVTHAHVNTKATALLTKCLGSIPQSKVNVTSTCIKKFSKKLSTSEISLIPIRKSFSNCTTTYEKTSRSSSIKISLSTGDNVPNDKNKSSLVESNLVLSTPVTNENGIISPKPLRPSVYIFSNYTNKTLPSIVSSSNEMITNTNNSSFDVSSSNQENRLQIMNGSIVSKRTGNNNLSDTSDWFPSVNFPGTNSLSNSINNSSNNQSHNQSLDCTPKNLALMQSFNSPNVISIDLTS